MAGTFADKALLANELAFIAKCRAAMIARAVELTDSATAQTLPVLQKMNGIIQSAGSDATNMAWRVACGNSTIGAAAPTVPSDSDTQFAVNTFLAMP